MKSYTRVSKAVWTGKDGGEGVLSSGSNILKKLPYDVKSRFGSEANTNPEELLAAAHACCFSMALDGCLKDRGFTAEKLEISCAVTITSVDKGFTITKSALTLIAKVPRMSNDEFQELARSAKHDCPVSRLFDTDIELDARLQE